MEGDPTGGPRVAIRVDAGPDLGLGHALRMQSLAAALRQRGAAVDVLGRGLGTTAVAGAPWTVRPLDGADGPLGGEVADAAAVCDLLGASAPDVVIVDHYGLGEDWERSVAERFPQARVVAVDDLPGRRHAVDLLIDPNLGPLGPAAAVGSSVRMVAGTAYAPLGAEYRAPVASCASSGSPRRVLVSLGGGRSGCIVGLVAALAAEVGLRDIALDVVVPDDAERAEVARILADRTGAVVHGRVPSLRPLLERADLVVGAGGTSAWQRLRLGLPTVMVALADNQRRTGEALRGFGLARWHEDDADPAGIAATVAEALEDRALRERAEHHGPLLVDGRGAERIAFALLPPRVRPRLRRLEQRDAAALFAMASDPETRANSREARPIAPAEHLAWFGRLRADARTACWVAESDGLVVGQVRLSPLTAGWELNYGLDPIGRGRGWSGPMVSDALRMVASSRTGPVIAVVQTRNVASARALTAVGFRPDEQGRGAEAAGARVPAGFTAYLLHAGQALP